MVRRCSDKMAKTLMVVFNALFLVCGVVVISVGVMEAVKNKPLKEVFSGLDALNVIAIVVGVFICFISFLGCCGALKENSCMLTTFLLLLGLILIAEIAIGGYAFKHRDGIKEFAREQAEKTFNRTDVWNIMQSDWKCCGINNYTDYHPGPDHKLPHSCCSGLADAKDCLSTDQEHLNNRGCLTSIEDFFKRNYLSVGVTAIVIAFIEVAGIIFACCLREAVKDKYETV